MNMNGSRALSAGQWPGSRVSAAGADARPVISSGCSLQDRGVSGAIRLTLRAGVPPQLTRSVAAVRSNPPKRRRTFHGIRFTYSRTTWRRPDLHRPVALSISILALRHEPGSKSLREEPSHRCR